MSDSEPGPKLARVRREPPRFRRVAVRRVEHVGPRMVRVTLAGSELDGLTVEDPAASVRLLLPAPGDDELVVPSWNGNEFLLADGRRPTIRTFTPYRVDADALEIDLEIVVHGTGVASAWAETAEPGDPAAISGPGRGYAVNRDARAFLLGGDETAIPAISQLLDAIPAEATVQVRVEVARPEGRLALPDHPRATVEWCDLPPGRGTGRRAGRRRSRCGPCSRHARLDRRRGGRGAAHPPVPLRGTRDTPRADIGAWLLEARPHGRHRRRRLNRDELRGPCQYLRDRGAYRVSDDLIVRVTRFGGRAVELDVDDHPTVAVEEVVVHRARDVLSVRPA